MHGTTIAGLTARLALARQLSSRQESDSDIWARTNKDLRQLPAYRKFKKMKLAPIPGLVPIGPDRQSGLLEFAHLGTGTPPKFDARGRLVGTGNAGLILVLLPPGSFLMGAHPTTGSNRDPQALSREQPVRQVSLTTFLISKYEMTQAQWKDATGKNPSLYVAHQQYSREMIGPRNPVTDVDWNDATRVLGQLGLELPTEAQWEYAARAGMHTVWPQGNHPSDLQGRANLADRAAQQASPGMACNSALDDGRHRHAPVGSYPPNRWGLFDMTGNIREWCRDQMTSYRVQPRWGDGLRKDSSSRSRMLRGGSWACLPAYARSAGRYWTKPDFRNRDVGLRPVLNIRNLAPQHK